MNRYATLKFLFPVMCFLHAIHVLANDNAMGIIEPDKDTLPLKRIQQFWQTTREQLNLIPIESVVEPMKLALPYHQYKITIKSLGKIKIVGLLAIPIQGESPANPWPVIISNPGYGGTQQSVMLSECQRGYAVLQVFPRGQGLSESFWKLNGADKLTWHIDQPEGYYYQGAYADVIRMIDFVGTRRDLDSNRIALVGTSQGGGISLAVAAIDPRVKAVVAHVPFLCNFRLAASTPNSLVKKLLDKEKCNDERALSTLDFFDPWQLAPGLKAPVLVSAGGKDETCPQETIQSVYGRLPGEKTLQFYPNLPHTSCFAFYNASWDWLDINFRNREELK